MITNEILRNTFKLMCYAQHMAEIYEQNRSVCKYVHSTSRGHEAIQLATAFQLKKIDWVSPYYRDESLLLGLGFEPYELMLQLLAKADDPSNCRASRTSSLVRTYSPRSRRVSRVPAHTEVLSR